MSDTSKTGAAELSRLVDTCLKLRRENAALRKTIDDLLEQLHNRNAENAALRTERNRYRVTLEDIAESAGLWASDKARAALRKEAQP